MTDEELLSRACHVLHERNHPDFSSYTVEIDGVKLKLGGMHGAYTAYWNPLIDDAHAFRLASFFRIWPKACDRCVVCGVEKVNDSECKLIQEFYSDHNFDECKATRRAIVRAVASMYKE